MRNPQPNDDKAGEIILSQGCAEASLPCLAMTCFDSVTGRNQGRLLDYFKNQGWVLLSRNKTARALVHFSLKRRFLQQQTINLSEFGRF